MGRMLRTEDEFLGRRKHVQRERHFVLVIFLLQPFDQARGLKEEKSDYQSEEHDAEGVGR